MCRLVSNKKRHRKLNGSHLWLKLLILLHFQDGDNIPSFLNCDSTLCLLYLKVCFVDIEYVIHSLFSYCIKYSSPVLPVEKKK